MLWELAGKPKLDEKLNEDIFYIVDKMASCVGNFPSVRKL